MVRDIFLCQLVGLDKDRLFTEYFPARTRWTLLASHVGLLRYIRGYQRLAKRGSYSGPGYGVQPSTFSKWML